MLHAAPHHEGRAGDDAADPPFSQDLAGETAGGAEESIGRRADREAARFGGAARITLSAWLLLIPALIALAAVSLYPILNGIWLSFTNTSLISNQSAFIGLKNYVALSNSGQFWNAWEHTVLFTLISTTFETIIGLLMAILLFETFVGRSFLRAIMLVPWAMPTVVTSKMFGWLFDGQHGVINYLLVKCGILGSYVDWLGSSQTALPTIIIADVWKTAPFMALLLLAGLQTISPTLTDAARIDGGALLMFLWSAGPFLWQFSTSFQVDKALTAATPSFIPHPFTLRRYENAFFHRHLWYYLRNSLIVALVTTLFCLVFGVCAAFSLSRLNIRGRFGLLMVILSVSMFPQIAIVGLLAFIAAWNEFLFALAFTSSYHHQTVPVGIANFTDVYYVPWGDISAASTVVTLPLIILVLFFQRHIIQGLTMGGLKE